MKIYTNNKNNCANISLAVETEEKKFDRDPNFFLVQEVIEREISTPIITETWDDALNAVYDMIKQALEDELEEGGDYDDCKTKDELFNSMEEDGALTLITGNGVYYFTAYGETSNHDNIDWKITPIWVEFN